MDTRAAWLSGLRSGDGAAFDAVYASYRPRLFGFLLRMVGQRSVAEELLQDCFVQLARHAPRLREDTDLDAWLFTVARNRARSWRRWSWLDASRILTLGSALSSRGGGPDPHAVLSAGEANRALERALSTLDPIYREALLLVVVEGLSPSQAAAALDVKPDTLRQRLSRARAALAQQMGLEAQMGETS